MNALFIIKQGAEVYKNKWAPFMLFFAQRKNYNEIDMSLYGVPKMHK